MTDNQDSVTAGAVQPPTDRPLTAGDFPWIKPMAEALAGYEADYGEGLDDMHELGRIDESRATPSFRIRVGHVRALAEILSRPATSAASEGEGDKLPDGAISGTDDGQTVWLESSTGGAHKLGVWGGLSLRFEEADGTHTIRDYVDAALAAQPVSERERELEGALAKAVVFNAYRAEDPLAIRLEFMTEEDRLTAANAIDKALTALPQEPV